MHEYKIKMLLNSFARKNKLFPKLGIRTYNDYVDTRKIIPTIQ